MTMNAKSKRIMQTGLFTLEVALIEGPMTDEFIDANPAVSRTIEIRGDQTLEELHKIIFKAFEREKEQKYEFQLKGEGPHDPKAQRYVLKEDMKQMMNGKRPLGEVSKTTIQELGLKVGEVFAYWFDFEDEWLHQIDVTFIIDRVPNGLFPRITKRKGKSPPQFADFGEDEGELDFDDIDDDED